MVNVQAQFDKAVAIVKALPPDGPVKPTQDDQLAFYGHFKQANEGDCTGPAPELTRNHSLIRPYNFSRINTAPITSPLSHLLEPVGAFDFKGKYKYRAWKALEGTTRDDAMAKYVELLKGMLEKTGDESSKKYLAELEAAGQT